MPVIQEIIRAHLIGFRVNKLKFADILHAAKHAKEEKNFDQVDYLYTKYNTRTDRAVAHLLGVKYL